MPLVSDLSICVRKHEYSETSQILTLFGRTHGLVRVIAKGAHRRTKAGASKFDGGLEVLDAGQAVFTFDPGRDLNTLTEWGQKEGHLEIRKNLRGMYLGLYAAELVANLIEEHDPHEDLFDRLASTIFEIATPKAEESFLAFQLDLLREIGLMAELNACVECGSTASDREAIYFSPTRGGIICRNCEHLIRDRIAFDVRLLRLLQQLLRLPRANGSPQRLPRLTRHQTDPLNRMFAEQIQLTLGRRLRMPTWVV